jgi:hypothetical protein
MELVFEGERKNKGRKEERKEGRIRTPGSCVGV